ncbi:amino acid synthesis family protein [Bosea sp. NPDC003192]|uniref:amino acid synthesis family protein n=1 Tax=Bosea sp. NPDC003192 TaxID=3390551 RepID=UPI003D064B32
MDMPIKRVLTIVDDRTADQGSDAGRAQRKVAVVAIVNNPYIGRYVEDLSPLVEISASIGAQMADAAIHALGPYEAQGYGKGGIVGLAGEQEHANALLTTTFATPFRDRIGGASAWISSMTKVAAPGTPIDIPMNAKTDVYVRSHYDGMSLFLPDAPLPNEIALIFCLSSGPRLNARVGGLRYEESVKAGALEHV